MTKRKALMAGNWKMNMNAVEGCRLAADVAAQCNKGYDDREVLLAPPFTILSEVSHALEGKGILTASQNVCWEENGAFTGEIAPNMVKDAGGSAAIVGHSERRHIFGESNEMINKRVKGGLAGGLMIILCIGETLEEREADRTFTVLEEQVRKGLDGVDTGQMEKIVIAYEPVWAIGTGKTASKEQAQEVHAFLRGLLDRIYEKDVADTTRILYGGSVKPANVNELMAQPDIDGALVGGAALKADSFGSIINFQ
ncbi:triose-phosphate isomerase [Desulforhopalus vacuolatus]|uniref:triose-phosphate isomerase n=1 Tax=Desulforhopalus vacuolatus TaxID=40414 RepID=UPI001964D6D0|nr:triose-phosphate isomerase [Desulforhopalus vacuolatus]MBM9518392.1 triose-phosphate isomerase [Desulforhopalus vacuolatus]